MLRRICGLLTAALAASTFAVAPAHAATTITLTGSSSGWANVTFTAATTLDAAATTYSVGGTYGGFYIGSEPYSSSTPHLLGITHTSVGRFVTGGFGRTTLNAGTYRLFLLADGSTTLTIPATGLAASISVSPANPVADQSGTWTTARSFSTPFWSGSGSHAVTTTASDLAVAMGFFRFPARVPAQYTEYGVCVAAAGSTCSGRNFYWGPNAGTNPKTFSVMLLDDAGRLGAGALDLGSGYLGLDDALVISTFGIVVPGVA